MTHVNRFAVAILSLSTVAAFGQQQFGPSPQAMYKQHPGSAPTYVSYGAPVAAPGSQVQTSTVATPRTAVRRTTSTATHHTTTAHKTTSTSGKGTTGR